MIAQPSMKDIETMMNKATNIVGLVAVGIASMIGSAQAKSVGMSPVGSLVVGGICGVGGGTVRDILLGRKAFWIEDPSLLYLTTVSGIVGILQPTTTTTKIAKSKVVDKVFTAAMGGCALAGVNISPNSFLPAAAFSILSASGSGMIRDIVMGNKVSALYPEGIAWTLPAVLGAGCVMAFEKLGQQKTTTNTKTKRMIIATVIAIGANRLLASKHPFFVSAREHISNVFHSIQHHCCCCCEDSSNKKQQQEKEQQQEKTK